MVVGETKIVIPDAMNARIVQVDDMSGTGWLTRTGGNIAFAGTFNPYDIDFDPAGRIYIANNNSSTGGDVVIRIDNMAATSYTFIADSQGNLSGIRALAVDRIRGYVYFSSSAGANRLFRCNLDGSSPTALLMSTITGIDGMDVDESGILYIAGDSGTVSYAPTLFRYDPVAQNVTASYGPGVLQTDWDVIVKSSNLYVSNLNSADGYRILLFNKDLNLINNFGNSVAVPASPVPNEFYGPKRFVAILNKKIYVTDEEEFTMSYARR